MRCEAQAFAEPAVWEELRMYRQKLAELHKLDQDHMIFHQLREAALEQGVLRAAAGPLQLTLLGKPLCARAYKLLSGIGSGRLLAFTRAVFNGRTDPPVDMRYMQGAKTPLPPSDTRREIFTFIQMLYDSVAECMPTETSGEAGGDKGDPYASIQLAGVELERGPKDEIRLLPPGTIFEQWRAFCSKQQVGFKVFWKVWMADFHHKLKFRDRYTFSVCTVCLKHKMMLQLLSRDACARVKQRVMYDRHLAAQRQDREWYWFLRAQSRMHTNIICIILDGMDQAKFMWPRSDFFGTHEFDGFQRPRLHILGFIVHGWARGFTVSHADTPKGSSVTVEVLSWLLTKLKGLGVELLTTHVHIQLDNTSSSNKNNCLLQWMGLLVSTKAVASCTANFLRVGHTHEDVDQMFGDLARWVLKKLRVAQNLCDFTASLWAFAETANWPHEEHCFVQRFDLVRGWKNFLANIRKSVSGIGGPGAPHVFSCVLRRSLPRGHVLAGAGAPGDVILRCRQWMHDRVDSAALETGGREPPPPLPPTEP